MPGTPESNRAMRLRAKIQRAQAVSQADMAWLQTYEATRKNNGNGTPGNPSTGRSAAKSRKVSYTEEESQAAAEGTGDAAAIAAGAMVARAEGERLDSILKIGVSALEKACEAYRSMCESLLAERQADAATHWASLESLRAHFLDRAEAEAELIRQQAEYEAAATKVEGGTEGRQSAPWFMVSCQARP